MLIYRKKINEEKKIYKYLDKNGSVIKDHKILDYIASLPAIPPAYNDVVIFYEKSPKIIFQGYDIKGKLQQIYSPEWRKKADKAKFKALIEFGRKLPMINMKILDSIKSPLKTKDKLISLIIRIITLCGFRIGHIKYHQLHGSIGLTTLMKKHIKIKSPHEMHINFLGKKGMNNDCVITDTLLINEIKKIIDTLNPNDFVFTYSIGDKKSGIEEVAITAIDVNNWLGAFNKDFTSKYFRTFAVNTLFIDLMKNVKPTTMTLSQRKKCVKEVLEDLSCSVNNTPTICKKSYMNMDLLNMFIDHPKKYETDINKNPNLTSVLKFIQFLEKNHK
jgi:DNA topoisomerase-1